MIILVSIIFCFSMPSLSMDNNLLIHDNKIFSAIEANDIGKVKSMLSNEDAIWFFNNDKGYTSPLHHAIYYNRPEILKMLCQHVMDVNEAAWVVFYDDIENSGRFFLTPHEYAVRLDLDHIALILEEQGALPKTVEMKITKRKKEGKLRSLLARK